MTNGSAVPYSDGLDYVQGHPDISRTRGRDSFAADIREAEKEAEKPPLFKKLFDGQTVEQQALNSVIAKKKLEEQEKHIRELIVWAYGTETYQEMIALRREIKARREKVIYKQRRKQRLIMDTTLIVIAALICGAIIFGTVSIIQG
jgi:serine/threonine protein phosphatase PrpC